jgi:hypothetical protein
MEHNDLEQNVCTTMMHTNVLNRNSRGVTALRIGLERPSVSPIHCGLISSYTAGLAAFGKINSLDKFNVHTDIASSLFF